MFVVETRRKRAKQSDESSQHLLPFPLSLTFEEKRNGFQSFFLLLCSLLLSNSLSLALSNLLVCIAPLAACAPTLSLPLSLAPSKEIEMPSKNFPPRKKWELSSERLQEPRDAWSEGRPKVMTPKLHLPRYSICFVLL